MAHLFKSKLHGLITVWLVLSSALAQATVVSYDFTATIDSLFEMGRGYVQSATIPFPGTGLSVGDTVKGSFFYDTTTPSSSGDSNYLYYYHPESTYQNGMQYTVVGTGMNYTGMSYQSSPSNITIYTETPGNGLVSDFVFTSANSWSKQSGAIMFYDPSGLAGTVFSSTELPSSLPFGNFSSSDSYSRLVGGWSWYGNFGDGHLVQFYAHVDSLSVSVVPEPSTYSMLLAGLPLIGFVSRRKRKSAIKS